MMWSSEAKSKSDMFAWTKIKQKITRTKSDNLNIWQGQNKNKNKITRTNERDVVP